MGFFVGFDAPFSHYGMQGRVCFIYSKVAYTRLQWMCGYCSMVAATIAYVMVPYRHRKDLYSKSPRSMVLSEQDTLLAIYIPTAWCRNGVAMYPFQATNIAAFSTERRQA
jgi:hypothetical protein